MSEAKKVAVVVGVGPGLSRSVAVRFAKEGYSVGLVSRTSAKTTSVAEEIKSQGGTALGVAADASNVAQITRAFDTIRAELGHPSVLVYNAGLFARGGILDIDPELFLSAFKVGCHGALLASQQVLPHMLEQKHGTIIFTGATASLRGGAKFGGFAAGKFALRALAQSAARELGPKGIHVAHVNIDGQINSPAYAGSGRDENSLLSPDGIADTYWHLHTQPPTTWTHELELRPSVERW